MFSVGDWLCFCVIDVMGCGLHPCVLVGFDLVFPEDILKHLQHLGRGKRAACICVVQVEREHA